MRVIPVIDVMDGQVVRAVGGRRSEYRPVRSKLTESTDPYTVALAMLAATGTDILYVADLDGIRHRTPSTVLLVSRLVRDGVQVFVDPGVRTEDDAYLHLEVGGVVVVGTETARGPSVLERLRVPGAAELAVSVALLNGRLLGDWKAWGVEAADRVTDLVGVALRYGVGSLFVLDLASVGGGTGPATLDICRKVTTRFPEWKQQYGSVITGGGVRSWDDVKLLEDTGVSWVLVASALHDGSLTFPRPVS